MVPSRTAHLARPERLCSLWTEDVAQRTLKQRLFAAAPHTLMIRLPAPEQLTFGSPRNEVFSVT
jgi:hypothetical protein